MLKVYNTLSRELEEFKPINPPQVLMYYCGPTLYTKQHLGNLRGMMCVDLIHRALVFFDYEVKLVRNYTDVGHLTSDADSGEDKMEKGVRLEKLSPAEIVAKYRAIYEKDTASLNMLEPTFKLLASDYVTEMIKMVQTLLDKGYAYATDLAIYYDHTKFVDYNKLSHQKIDENIEGAGNGEVQDKNKKHGADFALWFFKTGNHANALQYWPSPFTSPLVKNGEGLPGWHIECSAMSKKYLGNTLDIHMGGVEHVSVHHTNEIAQSEAANGVKFVNYWLHNEHLMVNGGKMAKSDGSGYTLDDVVVKGFDPLAVRYFFLQAHYRSKQNFTFEALEAASNAFNRLRKIIADLGSENGEINHEYKEKFQKELAIDFNVPNALAVVWELVRDLSVSAADKRATLVDFDRVLGLKLDEKIVVNEVAVTPEVQKLLDERQAARQNKDWQKSDELRDELQKLGIAVEDTAEGQLVRRDKK